MTILPADIKPTWLNVIRRLQSMSRRQEGLAILTIRVLVDQDGNPRFYTEPQMVRLEPKHKLDFDALTALLIEALST